MLEFTICVSSTDCSDLYSNNTPYSFVVELPYPINLPGNWRCNLDALYCNPHEEPPYPLCIHVLLDFVKPSLIYNSELPVIATLAYVIPQPKILSAFIPPFERSVPVNRQIVKRFQVDILDTDLQPCKFLAEKTIINLKFIKQDD